MPVTPIRPDEVAATKSAPLPDGVFEAFNDLITKNFDGNKATVLQKDAMAAVALKLGICETEVFSRKLLDVEQAYGAAGWKVRYDQSAYNESYEAFFEFRK